MVTCLQHRAQRNLHRYEPMAGKGKMNLRKMRIDNNLSVPALARMSGIPVRTIEDIERRGDCRVSTAIRLADAFGV